MQKFHTSDQFDIFLLFRVEKPPHGPSYFVYNFRIILVTGLKNNLLEKGQAGFLDFQISTKNKS